MKSLGGKTYECTDFYLSTTFKDLNILMLFKWRQFLNHFGFLAFIMLQKMMDSFQKKKKKYFCKESGMRIIIPINSKKKRIKIKSSISKFFWSLDFTQKDYSYLPVPSGSSLNYINGSVANIRNPYSFTQNKNTNCKWYIIIYHYNKKY